MVSRTREKLIDVARQLFAHKGVENTTMNDIATASDKGRRTIYTYFKNKVDIFNAVVERECEQLVAPLAAIVESDAAPTRKIREYLQTRIDLFSNVQHRRDYLSAIFGRDTGRIHKLHQMVLEKEQPLLARILNEGVDYGVFDADRALLFPSVCGMVILGFDSAHLREVYKYLPASFDDVRRNTIKYLIGSLLAAERAED